MSNLSEARWFFVNAMGTSIGFEKNGCRVLHETPKLTSIWGYPAKQAGFYKPASKNVVYSLYEIDFSVLRGKALAGSVLHIHECVSCNSLSDANIYMIAVAPSVGVVSKLTTSYWVSDKDDVPDWKFGLLQKTEYLTMPVLA